MKKQDFKEYLKEIEFYLNGKLTQKEKIQLKKEEIYFDDFTGELEKNFITLDIKRQEPISR